MSEQLTNSRLSPLGRKRMVWLLLSLFVMALVVTVIVRLARSEPTYEGKAVSEWLALLLKPNADHQADFEKARRALIKIGTPAIPELDRILRQRPGTWRETENEWLIHWGFREPEDMSLKEWRLCATRAAYLLAEEGNVDIRRLIPHLRFDLTNSNDYASSENARALARAGMEGFKVLTNLMFTGSSEVRRRAAWGLNFINNRPEAITTLVRFAHTETDSLSRVDALKYLHGSQGPAELLVPLGLEFLHSKDAYERWAGALVLDGYTAHEGVEEALRKATEDPDKRVCREATRSLKH